MISYNDKGFSEAGGAISCICIACKSIFYRKTTEIYDKMGVRSSRLTEKYISKRIEKEEFDKLVVDNERDAKILKIYICNDCIFKYKLFS